jgi:hypothetical protein
LKPASEAREYPANLFRAVSVPEWEDILACGRMRAGPNSLLGKWFAERSEDAEAWGSYGKSHGSGDYLIVEAAIPGALFSRMYYVGALDGIGPAWYVDGPDLESLTCRRF